MDKLELMDKSEPLGKGTLTGLAELKAEHGPRFRAAAPKRRKITQECGDLLCPYAVKRARTDGRGMLWIKNEWCAQAKCPREGNDGKTA